MQKNKPAPATNSSATPSLPRAKPVTTLSLQAMKARGESITMVTCYDATFARLVDEGGIDAILVGDSLGMVVKGEENTLAVTLEEMAYHTAAVARGLRANGPARVHLVGDMPFLTYQVSPEEAVRNAGRLLQAGAAAVKLEGGASIAPTVRRMTESGIPVMGHVGLVPQSVHAMGGFKVQGKDSAGRAQILADALALQEAGAYAIVIEGVPPDVAEDITAALEIPTIGIGAGRSCDGQVLVLYDLLGLNPAFKPKFVKHFTDGASVVTDALRAYVSEVQTGAFPGPEHTFRPSSPANIETQTHEKKAPTTSMAASNALLSKPDVSGGSEPRAHLPDETASYGRVVPN